MKDIKVKNKFLFFSGVLFLVIAVSTFMAYIIIARQINREYIQQQLAVLSETIKLNLATEINKELSLVIKLGYSPVIRGYFEEPDNAVFKAFALEELRLFEEHSSDGQVSWISDIDKICYGFKHESYVIDPDDPDTYWYNLTLYETEEYNFNINYKKEWDDTFLWLNVPVYSLSPETPNKPIGMIATGIKLTQIINLIESAHGGQRGNISIFLFNNINEITIAKDIDIAAQKVLIDDYLGDAGKVAIRMLETFENGEGQSFVYGNHMYRLGIVPAIKDWNILLSYPFHGVLSMNQPMNFVFFGMLCLIFFLFIIINFFVMKSENRMLQHNKQLLEANQKAEFANKAKSDFLAVMSHEIRTPLNAVIGVTQIQLQKRNHSEELTIALENIYNSGKNLLGIINDLLDLSKIESGKMDINHVEYDLPSLINDTVHLNIVRIGSKPVEFILDVSEILPSVLIGDELRIKQILNNLLSNAIKYTEKGHVKLSVSHTRLPWKKGHDREIYLQFTVEDTGQGMKYEDCERLFSEEYLRFNPVTNRTTEGTGIGLKIVKNLVDLMDGSIVAESEYGEGSVFKVMIKQKANDYKPIGIDLSNQLRNFTFAGRKRFNDLLIPREYMPYGKVLVVDDVETNLIVAEGLMLPYGLKIETVISGFAAIEKIRKGAIYDVIFMDHMMPTMDGIETTKRLREMGYTGVIVSLTANAIVGNAEMFKDSGFDDFISKPIDAMMLNTVLNTFVRDRHPEEAEREKKEAKKNFTLPEQLLNPKMFKAFLKDADNAIVKLKESHVNSDYKLFVTTAHAMKSALANIGEDDASDKAYSLEKAGKHGDTMYIETHLEYFIEYLKNLIISLTQKK